MDEKNVHFWLIISPSSIQLPPSLLSSHVSYFSSWKKVEEGCHGAYKCSCNLSTWECKKNSVWYKSLEFLSVVRVSENQKESSSEGCSSREFFFVVPLHMVQ